MATLKNFFWLLKVISFCVKNNYKVNPSSYKNLSFCGPRLPLIVQQEQFIHGWRFVAKSEDHLIEFKFPAHYNSYNVETTLWNKGYKSVF